MVVRRNNSTNKREAESVITLRTPSAAAQKPPRVVEGKCPKSLDVNGVDEQDIFGG